VITWLRFLSVGLFWNASERKPQRRVSMYVPKSRGRAYPRNLEALCNNSSGGPEASAWIFALGCMCWRNAKANKHAASAMCKLIVTHNMGWFKSNSCDACFFVEHRSQSPRKHESCQESSVWRRVKLVNHPVYTSMAKTVKGMKSVFYLISFR
jgi:hypothetical protein